MLYRWLSTDEECNVPKYAHTFLGVGAFVFNKDTNEILVIKERHASKISWKLPGGYVEPGILQAVVSHTLVYHYTCVCIFIIVRREY